MLIDHIVVEDDAIVIKHIIPTDDDCQLLPGRRCTQIFSVHRKLSNTGFTAYHAVMSERIYRAPIPLDSRRL